MDPIKLKNFWAIKFAIIKRSFMYVKKISETLLIMVN